MIAEQIQNIVNQLTQKYPDFFTEDIDKKEFVNHLEKHYSNYEIVWRSIANNNLIFVASKGLNCPIVTRRTQDSAYTVKL